MSLNCINDDWAGQELWTCLTEEEEEEEEEITILEAELEQAILEIFPSSNSVLVGAGEGRK